MTNEEVVDPARHAEKMKKKQAARAKIMASKTGEKGLVIVHTGTGKGKTTAALFHVVLGPDAHRGNVRLRAYHMLKRGHQLVCEAAMCHQDHANHRNHQSCWIADSHGGNCRRALPTAAVTQAT